MTGLQNIQLFEHLRAPFNPPSEINNGPAK